MWHELLIALCLMLVLEGIYPFLSPKGWRKLVISVAALDDKTIRLVGFCSMIGGTLCLYFVN